MGKPVANFAWSASGNYPAGPNLWNGQPLALQPAGTFFTPNVKPSAEEFNWSLGTLASDIAALAAWAGSAPAVQWTQAFTSQSILPAGPTDEQFGAVQWSTEMEAWLVAAQGDYAGNWTGYVYSTPGLDYSSGWTAIGGALGVTPTTAMSMAVCEDPHTSGFVFCVVANSGSGQAAVVNHWNGSAWAISLQTAGGATGFAGVAATSFQGRAVYATASSDAGNAFVQSSGDGGGSWSTAQVIAAPDGVYFAQSRTLLLLVPRTASTYYTTSDGVTWTTRTNANVNLANSDSVRGVTWTQDSGGACFLMAIYNSTSGQTRYVRSSDGINWTAQSNPSSLTQLDSIAAVGSLVTAIESSGSNGAIIASPDGGKTWYRTQAAFASSVSGAVRPTVVSNGALGDAGCQFIMFEPGYMRLSQVAGLGNQIF